MIDSHNPWRSLSGKFLAGIFFVVFFSGCTSAFRHISDDYQKIDYSDGISKEEAVLIAQNDLMDKLLMNDYETLEPQIIEEMEGIPKQDQYWFISFREVQQSTIPTRHLVAVSKEDGSIKFSDRYYPGKNWALLTTFH